MIEHDLAAEAQQPGSDEPSPRNLNLLRVFKRALKRPERACPQPDLKHIAAAVAKGGDRASVREHNRARYMSTAGVDAPLFRELLRRAEFFLEEIEKRLAALKKRARSGREFRGVVAGDTPLSVFAIVRGVVFALVASTMLYVGLQAMATMLQRFDPIAFADRTNALTFSLVPIAASFVWEALAFSFKTELGRNRFVAFVYISALVLAALWVPLFVAFVGDAGATVGDAGNDLPVWGEEPTDAEEGKKRSHALLIVSLLAECMIAASCWLTIDSLVREHRYSKPVVDRYYKSTRAEMTKLWRLLPAIDEICGSLRSRIQAIEKGCDDYVQQAEDLFVLAMKALKNEALVVSALIPAVEKARQPTPEEMETETEHEQEETNDEEGTVGGIGRSVLPCSGDGASDVLRDRSSGCDGRENGEGDL